MRKSIIKRIKITAGGKISRRSQGLGHSRVNKNRKQALRRRGDRSINYPQRVIRKEILSHFV